MKRRRAMRRWAYWMLCAVVPFTVTCPAVRRSPGKDVTTVVILTVDTFRHDAAGPGRNPRFPPTPNLDRLIGAGASYQSMRTPIPITLPSHLALFTSRLPANTGIRDNGALVPDGMDGGLPAVFKGEGFATAAFVSSRALNRRYWSDPPFDVYDDTLPNGLERPGAQTLDALETYLARPDSARKEFIWVHLNEPHEPYDPPAPYKERFGETYAGEVAAVDGLVGRLTGIVYSHGRSPENTLVVFLADHGESLGEHGEATHGTLLYDATLRVPCAFTGPGIPTGRIHGEASILDVAPTVVAYMGWEATAADSAGESLFRKGHWVGRNSAQIHESLSGYYHYGWAPLFARTEAGKKYILAPEAEYFDLDADPGEMQNLAFSRSQDIPPIWLEELRAYVGSAPADTGSASGDPSLAGLGYVWAGTAQAGDPPDPKKMIGVEPDIKRAVLAFQTGDIATAGEFAERVLRLDAGNLAMESFAIEADLAAGRTEQGRARLRKVIPQVLTRSDMAGNASRLLAQYLSGDPDTEKLLMALESSQPQSADVQHYLGAFYAIHGRHAEAVARFERAFGIRPGPALAFYAAHAAILMGDRETSWSWLTKMSDFRPGVGPFTDPWVQEAFGKDPRLPALVAASAQKGNN